MLVERPIPGFPDSQQPSIKINISPLQAKDLTLSQTQRKYDRPPSPVVGRPRGGEEPLHPVQRVRLDLVKTALRVPWRCGRSSLLLECFRRRLSGIFNL